MSTKKVAPRKLPDTPANFYLDRAKDILSDRGQTYDRDREEQERSGVAIAAAFSAITGKVITAAEVYLMLQITKDVRQWAASHFHEDSAQDSVCYAALKSEALEKGE